MCIKNIKGIFDFFHEIKMLKSVNKIKYTFFMYFGRKKFQNKNKYYIFVTEF